MCGSTADNIGDVKRLYRKVNLDKDFRKVDELQALVADLENRGYSFEWGHGYYMHCPDGTTVTLDEWNEEEDC